MELLPFQKTAVEQMLNFLRLRKVTYNACEMGLGKTIQTINVLSRVKSTHLKDLIICPAVMGRTWRKEMEQSEILSGYITVIESSKEISNLEKANYAIISYELAAKNAEYIGQFGWDSLVLDEAHKLKSHKTKRSKAIFKHIWPKATYKIALSGTPFTQCVTDCHTLFSRMAPDIFGEPDTQGWYAFANKFANQTRTPFGTTYHGLRNPVLLKKLIRENFFVRYLKEEVLPELPPKIWTEITLPPSYNVKGVYSKDPEVRKDIAKAIKAVNDGLPLPPPTHTAHYREQQGLLKIPAVIEFAENLLEENVPIILFAYHTSVIEKYTEALKKYNPAVITGATSAKARNKAVEDFQAGNTILFIGQLVAGGVGITLTTGSNLILAELDWSPANVSQACDRAHRIGQRVPVNIYYFVAEGSIDKDLQKAIIQKAKDFKEVMN